MKNNYAAGWQDLQDGLLNLALPLYLAWSDIRQRYRRSSLGPFWITISTGVMIACIGIIFGSLFKAPMSDFLPFLAGGLIIWGFIAGCIGDATTVFVDAEAVIKQLPLPLSTHILRMVSKNLYIFFHNILIYPVVLVFVERPLGIDALWFFPGIALLTINLLWIAIILGTVCARFRDLTQIIASVLQIIFYITPIIWMPGLLPEKTSVMILDPNPFYHLMEIVRAPLMNQAPTGLNWTVSICLALFGWGVAILFFNKYRSRVAYWL